MRSVEKQWFVRYSARPLARTQLFCFPWSGAGAGVFREWAQLVPEDVEVIGVSLPGRDHRRDEVMSTSVEGLADVIAPQIAAESAGEIALFGHSFGALLAHSVAVRLTRLGRSPVVVVVSGSRPPNEAPVVALHQLDDVTLVSQLVRMGGLTAERARVHEFVEKVIPRVRADLTACECYRPDKCQKAPWRLCTWAGTRDWYAPPEQVRRWDEIGVGGYREHVFEGDHFFLARTDDVLSKLIEDLRVGACGHRLAAAV